MLVLLSVAFFYEFVYNIIKLQKRRSLNNELKFTDDFLFCRILSSNPELCRQLLEIILNKKIKSMALAEAHKSEQLLIDGKGIRLDVYVYVCLICSAKGFRYTHFQINVSNPRA